MRLSKTTMDMQHTKNMSAHVLKRGGMTFEGVGWTVPVVTGPQMRKFRLGNCSERFNCRSGCSTANTTRVAEKQHSSNRAAKSKTQATKSAAGWQHISLSDSDSDSTNLLPSVL